MVTSFSSGQRPAACADCGRMTLELITRPVKELKAFRRVSLQPGASTIVEFTLAQQAFAYWNEQMKYLVEPGNSQT